MQNTVQIGWYPDRFDYKYICIQKRRLDIISPSVSVPDIHIQSELVKCVYIYIMHIYNESMKKVYQYYQTTIMNHMNQVNELCCNANC